MNKTTGHIIETVLTIALLAVMLAGLGKLCRNKNSYGKYNEFYKYAGDYDVLFCGSSHMMNMALPMELWKEYGIRSYNIGNGAETIPITYHVLKNALDATSPKIVVMDVFYSYSNHKVPDVSIEMPHQYFDLVPLSNDKAAAVFDLFDEDRDRWNYLYDFSVYHNRWSELNAGDIIPADEGLGGARILLESYSPQDETFDPPKLHEMASVPKEYLTKIKEMCNDRGIRLICVVNPYAMWQENGTGNVDYEKEMESLGIEFVDLRESDVVDMAADCADNMHLNIGGQRKITNRYGQILLETGLLPDYTNADNSEWGRRYEAYVDKKAEFLGMCDNCSSLLTDLNDPAFEFDIEYREDAPFDKAQKKMLDNASDNKNVRISTNNAIDADIIISVRRTGESSCFIKKSFDL